MTDHQFIFPPKYVGYYEIGGPQGIQISLKKEPNWLHRTMMRLCFGIRWKRGRQGGAR
jgi:hypothetical protein